MIAYADGGCSPNPGGLASWAWLIETNDGNYVAHASGVISPGATSSNVAEYEAVVRCLEYAVLNDLPLCEVRADSQLVVRQVRGLWKTKASHLRPLRDRARELLATTGASTRWIPRTENECADALARKARLEWYGETNPVALGEGVG